MKSIAARATIWYAVASLITLGTFFRVGRYLVEQHVIHSLDLGIAAEFTQTVRRLGPDISSLEPDQMRERLLPYSPVRFAIEIVAADGTPEYRSRSLGDRSIPLQALRGELLSSAIDRLFRPSFASELSATPATRYYNAIMPEIGELRIGEFPLGRYRVLISVSKEQVRSLVTAYQDVIYWLFGLMLLASTAIGYLLSNLLLRPLRVIQATATHIGSQNLGERIPVSGVKDELSDLSRLLNEMFDRLEASFNQTRRFAAEASHELKTPLSLVRLQAEKLLLDGSLKPPQEELVQVQLEELARLNQIIEELLFLSRAEAHAIPLQTLPQAIAPFLEGFAADARVLAESRGAQFVDRIAMDGRASFDPKWIRQVLLNLVSNALNVSPRGGTVTLASGIVAGTWRVEVLDEGPGVPKEHRERIFERFVRLGEGGGGSGLGLAISRSIVNLHRGTIRAEEGPGGHGLRVVFEIPTEAG